MPRLVTAVTTKNLRKSNPQNTQRILPYKFPGLSSSLLRLVIHVLRVTETMSNPELTQSLDILVTMPCLVIVAISKVSAKPSLQDTQTDHHTQRKQDPSM